MRWARLVPALGAVAFGCTQTTELIAASAPECTAPGPLVRLVGADDTTCAGAVASRLGRYALCTCTDLILTGDLSVKGPRGMGGMGAGSGGPPPSFLTAVGTDGNASISGMTDLSGSFLAAGAGAVVFNSGGIVRGNLHVGGNLTTFTRTMPVLISGEAYAGGDVTGRFMVGGALHVPLTSTVVGGAQAQSVVQEAVTVEPPCGCGAGPVFDISAAVASRMVTNANASLAFPSVLLANETANQTLDWPCGEYYLTEIRTGSDAALEFRVHGRVGIFVAGDVRLGNNLHVALDPGAELDLVVGGSFFMTGRVFGSPEQPTSTRLWVGSTTVSLPDQVQFGAAVYAPAAVFSAGVGMTFSGTLFVGTLSVAGDVRIAYDPAATQAGQSCGVAVPAPVE